MADSPTPASVPRAKRDTPWSLILFAVLAVYGVLLAILNSDEVEISFVFFTARISLLVLVLLCLGIGFAAGYLLDRLRVRRRRAASAE
ncbi:MAG TPA: lipopolysaccharide assembly protein LapA domain-containing protein [Gaiellaceae bacterium]|jgi:uncharacterized integral membrane protein|nr:lipopolysaccharide assembly protein LapA domain-containing protein [Gaiellaceae bacterium]